MAEEIAALERIGTWDLVPCLLCVRPITCKWVYKVKTRSDGSLERYKTRFVARDFQQEQRRDYYETFAPVAHMTTIHTLLAVASVREWSISQLDVKNAFLNGELRENIYMRPPPWYSVPEGMVCHIRRSLYGLKQAPVCSRKKKCNSTGLSGRALLEIQSQGMRDRLVRVNNKMEEIAQEHKDLERFLGR
jgi:hypothetical protein